MTSTKPNAKSNAKPAGPSASAKRSYAAAVKVARSASQSAWIIGDAAAKVASLAGFGDGAMRQFADDIGQNVATVRNFRTMAERFPAAGPVSRDLQYATVYGIFASQDDADKLITKGDGGKPWTVTAARKFVASRKTPKVADRDALVSRIATLREQLAAAESALTEYDATHKPASKPASTAKASTAKASTAKASTAKPAAKASTAKASTAKPAAKASTAKPAAKASTAKPAAKASTAKASQPASEVHMAFRGIAEHAAGQRTDVCRACQRPRVSRTRVAA